MPQQTIHPTTGEQIQTYNLLTETLPNGSARAIEEAHQVYVGCSALPAANRLQNLQALMQGLQNAD